MPIVVEESKTYNFTVQELAVIITRHLGITADCDVIINGITSDEAAPDVTDIEYYEVEVKTRV